MEVIDEQVPYSETRLSKNDADSEILRGILESKGYEYTSNPANANYIFINTCGFIEDAKKKVLK